MKANTTKEAGLRVQGLAGVQEWDPKTHVGIFFETD